MGIFDIIKNELIDVIDWTDNTQNTMVHRFERAGNEIKMGAKLIVRESQTAVFINEGELADVFEPGTYTLSTQNMPVLTKLKSWKYGFNSPFKAEVYFVNTKVFTNQKWGTPGPVVIRDADFGRVTIRAFGTYSIQIKDPATFLKKVVGTNQTFTTESIAEELRSMIVTNMVTAIGNSGTPFLDFASNYKKLSEYCQGELAKEFPEYGLDITKFLVSNINLPEELQKALDEGTSLNMLGDMNRYQTKGMVDAMKSAANNPGGGAGGMESMMGMMMMNQMMQNQQNQMNQQFQQQNQMNQQGAGVPPPPPFQQVQYYAMVGGAQQGPLNMQQLQQYIAQGAITQNTYVWKQGMANWQEASQVAEIAQLFGAVPPPPPAQ